MLPYNVKITYGVLFSIMSMWRVGLRYETDYKNPDLSLFSMILVSL